MIITTVTIRSRAGDRVLTRTFAVSRDYGSTAELAHFVVVVALTAASRPVLVDLMGRPWRIPRSRLLAIVSRDVLGAPPAA